jgi:hypothetical protein
VRRRLQLFVTEGEASSECEFSSERSRAWRWQLAAGNDEIGN